MTSYLTLFLGGTAGQSTWRDSLIPMLDKENLQYFNPVVKDWNQSAVEKEYIVKNSRNTIESYVITKDMQGVFSIAEVVDASNKKPSKTIFLVLTEGFDNHQLKSLKNTEDLVRKNGAYIAGRIEDIFLFSRAWNYPTGQEEYPF